ncbi:DUF2905 domain-containing protein [candidate division WOR-3 bacterium]|uniref:DUF2905 domain-containing protein n=1 Tax=candidate division WOR-3 bacterium TaxID=2052148 RepID=A0A660SLJ2_UNCW3|nr:MAG: DUF2905 domain-containing protein [candidate division WOR-3 bacterium]
MFGSVSRFLILVGLLLIFFGLALQFFPKIPFFRLPGDIVIQRKNFVFYFPIVTVLILSLIFSILLNIFSRR